MSKYILLYFVLVFFGHPGGSQTLQINKFIVVTFSENYSKGIHGSQNYFWIIPIDSIKSYTTKLYPLYLSNYTKSQFTDCLKGLSIDPSIPSLKPGDYNFDSIWYKNHDDLIMLVTKERKLIQTINKIWESGNKATIKVYATPILGEFCSCNFSPSGEQKYGYVGRIYLAHNFSNNFREFWNSELAKYILKHDYANLNFKKTLYPEE